MLLYIRAKGILEDEGQLSYYGPFDESEIEERLNDAYADLLVAFNEIDAVLLSLAETAHMYINPREFWMTQLAAHS